MNKKKVIWIAILLIVVVLIMAYRVVIWDILITIYYSIAQSLK